jgi:hypothetical protein
MSKKREEIIRKLRGERRIYGETGLYIQVYQKDIGGPELYPEPLIGEEYEFPLGPY